MRTWNIVIEEIRSKSEEDKISINAMLKEIDFVDKIIKIRNKKGVTQKELAQKVGMTQSAIARFESQANSPKLDTVMKIAEALEITIGIEEEIVSKIVMENQPILVEINEEIEKHRGNYVYKKLPKRNWLTEGIRYATV